MADQCIRQGWVCFHLVLFVFNLALAYAYRNRRPFTLLESRRRFAFQFHKARAPDISLCAISGLGLDNSLSTHVIELLCSVSIDCFVVGRVVGRQINFYIYLYKTMTCGSLWRRGRLSHTAIRRSTYTCKDRNSSQKPICQFLAHWICASSPPFLLKASCNA